MTARKIEIRRKAEIEEQGICPVDSRICKSPLW